MESKVSRRLKEPPAPEVCDAIYAPRLARDFGVVFPYLTDVNQSHVLMLHKSGLVTRDIARKLAAGLLQMEAEGPGHGLSRYQLHQHYRRQSRGRACLLGGSTGGAALPDARGPHRPHGKAVAATMLKRAQENFATATDLADLLVRDADLSFGEAHHIVGAVVRTAMDQGFAAHEITSAMVDEVARAEVGRALTLPDEAVRKSLDPVCSVQGRTVRGGPAKAVILELVAEGRDRLTVDRRGTEARRKKLADARATLKRETAVLAGT